MTDLGFGRNFVQWIQLFNKDIQNIYKELYNVESHRKSSISAKVIDKATQFYLFILDGQIQSILISQCVDIKGISINNLEFKITQYDTTLFKKVNILLYKQP